MKLFLILALVFPLIYFPPAQVLAEETSTAVITISPRGFVSINEKVLGATSNDKAEVTVSTETSNVEEVEIDRQAGQINLKTKTATGSSTRKVNKETLLIKVEAAEKKNDIRVFSRNGKLELEQNGIQVTTEFNLKVDTDANLITAITPDGNVQIVALPTEIVKTLEKDNKIDRASELELVSVDKKLVYKVVGEKHTKLFGLFQTQFTVTGFVDPGTGEVTRVNLPFVLHFFGFLFSK